MTNLSHYTVTTGELRVAPRSEVDERTLEMLTPVVRAGFGIVGGLSIVLETHRRDADGETWVFTLGFKADTPAVRCWLSRGSSPDLWQFGVPEPPAPWLAVASLDEAANLSPEQISMLGDSERCVAWALLGLRATAGRSNPSSRGGRANRRLWASTVAVTSE